MLIKDLVAKTSVEYEILTWINTPDPFMVKFIEDLKSSGVPIKIVGRTPEGIGMNAFKYLFKESRYEMIAQIDDDVLRVSHSIPQICKDIFDRRKEVKYLVADVWQDAYTTGNRPHMSSYKCYSSQDSLFDGPIDSWYGVYHRSIMDVLMKAPYERYFYLGSFVRGTLPSLGQIGLLCRKFKVFHGCGPVYAAALGMLEFEINKFSQINSPMAGAYAKAKIPDIGNVLKSFEEAKAHIDSFGGDKVSPLTSGNAVEPEYAEVVRLVSGINKHYGLSDGDLRIIFDHARQFKQGAVFVEIGVCHGRTSAMLAYVAKCIKGEYHGVDQFGFDGNSKQSVEKTIRDIGLDATFHEGCSHGKLSKAPACPTWSKEIDLLFIDGGHDEPNVRGDCEVWIPRLKPGGLVIFDDWNNGEPYTNAHWAIKYYSEQCCKGWDVLLTNHKIHIRRKPLK